MAGSEAAGAMAIPVNDHIDSSGTGFKKNPLCEIESDIRVLMKNCGKLNYEMDAYKNKTESDTKKMLLNFIEVADAFENVFRNIESRLDSADQQAKTWVSNFRTVYRLLQRSLNTWGVIPIETVIGEKANPNWHNVFEVVEQPEREDETIVEEIKKGYMWNGKLLRAADVKTVRNAR